MVVHRWEENYIKSMSIMECYFISQDNKKRVFYSPVEVGISNFSSAPKVMKLRSKRFYAYNDWDPIPTEPGFIFDGGIIVDSGKWRPENAVVAFDLPKWPGIGGYFACYGVGIKEEFMFEREGYLDRLKQAMSSITILQKGNCSLNGIPAQELCAAATEEGRRMYNFDLEAPSTGKDLARPLLVLHMMSKNKHNENAGNGFESDDEALAVWNTIRNSIRLRPGAI